ncbi:MAG: ferric reductase-like transmembrane domain-containing protein [Mycobacteriales bacterium]
MSTAALASAASTPFSKAPLWYLTRSTGIVSFVLITVSVALGVAATQRALASPRWPRFATQALHRNVSLLGMVFLLVHITTTVVDSFVNVSWLNAVVPFTSSYKRLGVGLGALAFDLLLLVVVTSLLRLRLPQRLWRAVHLSVYGAWPISLLHFLKTGTEARHGSLGSWLALGATLFVGAAVALRLMTSETEPRPVASITR